MTSRRRRSAFLDWKAVVGIALGIALLALSLRGVQLGEVLSEIRRADPVLFLISIAFTVVPILVRAWRWRAILEPVRSGTSFRARFRSTMIGFMANNVLPARIGEFARAYTLARMERVPVVASFGTLVLERIFDGLVLVSSLFLAIALPGFPSLDAIGIQDPGAAARVVLLLLLGLMVFLIALVIWPRRAVAVTEAIVHRILPESFRRPVIDGLEAFLSGIGSLRNPGLLLRASHWSLWVWFTNALGFWFGFRAFGIDVPFTAALFLQSLIALAVALPAGPGFFGPWEAAARLGLHDIYGVGLDKAIGFAIGFHMGGFLAVTLWGLYYAWRLGISWREVETSEVKVESAVEHAEPSTARNGGADAP